MIFLRSGILGSAVSTVVFSISQSAFSTSNQCFCDQHQKSSSGRERGAVAQECGQGAVPVADHPCVSSDQAPRPRWSR